MLRFATFASGRGQASSRTQSRSIAAQSFPVEVWEAIIAACPHTGTPIFPLLTVNSAFFRAVEHVLYRHVNPEGDTLEHATRRIQLFYRLANDSHVAAMVESFTLPPLISDPDDLLASHIASIYVSALQRALCAMTHLRSLTVAKLSTSLEEDMMGNLNNLQQFFTGCTFRLRSLSIIYDCDGKKIPLVETMQQDLQELTITPKLDSVISIRAFPKLRVLAVVAPGIDSKPRLLSKSRDILALYWVSRRPSFQGGPFPSVRSLRLSLAGVDLLSLVTAFSSLQYLRLDLESPSPGNDYTWVLDHCQHLNLLPFLRKVTFGGQGPLEWRSFALRQTIATSLFTCVPQLESVSIGVELWDRKNEGRVLMAAYPDEWKDVINLNS